MAKAKLFDVDEVGAGVIAALDKMRATERPAARAMATRDEVLARHADRIRSAAAAGFTSEQIARAVSGAGLPATARAVAVVLDKAPSRTRAKRAQGAVPASDRATS